MVYDMTFIFNKAFAGRDEWASRCGLRAGTPIAKREQKQEDSILIRP